MSARTTAERVESIVLAAILTVVAVAAGWASFTHVHDWTMRHAPTGTPDAFGWVNAVISELVPVAAFLTIRRRKRAHQTIGYPLVLLIAAATLSLAAQLAVAQPSPSGWLLSAVPALAFMALVKLIFTGSPTPEPAPAAADKDTTESTAADRAAVKTAPPSITVTEPDTAAIPITAPPTRKPGLVPIPADTFTRLNGATVHPEVTTR